LSRWFPSGIKNAQANHHYGIADKDTFDGVDGVLHPSNHAERRSRSHISLRRASDQIPHGIANRMPEPLQKQTDLDTV
jgi:hypothetical protein